MQIFYTPNIESDLLTLDADESKHCIEVLRHKNGDTICVYNGKGLVIYGEIIDANRKKALIQINERIEHQPKPYNLHIAIAPVKNADRFEWFVEKAVEIGIDEITPIICNRSERKILRTDRLEKTALSAMKQSKNAYLPKINEAISLAHFLKSTFNGTKCIAHCIDNEKTLLCNVATNNTILLIGPEGDFTNDEITACIKSGYIPVSLGSSRLRTETAGVYACAVIQNQFNLKL